MPAKKKTTTTKKTVRKKSSLSSAEHELLYESLFNNVPSGIAVYEVKERGKKFIFKDFNHAAEKIEGLKKKDVIGKDLKSVFPGVEEMGLLKSFQEVYKTGKEKYLEPTKYEDGEKVFWRENHIYKLPSGEIMAVYNDVSKRMNIEEKLRENLEELEKFNKLMVNRELKMIELKEALKKLARKTGHLNDETLKGSNA